MPTRSELRSLLAVALALVLVACGRTAIAAESSLAIDKLATVEGEADPLRYFVHRREHDDHDHDHDHDEDHDYDYDEQEDDEHDFEDLEVERVYVEMERASLETMYGAMELVEKIAHVAAEDDGVVALAVVTIKDAFEDEQAIELLEEVVEKAPSKVARRLARMQLIEVYGERDELEKVRTHLRALIFAKD